MAHVASLCFGHGVVVDVNDLVQVLGDNLGDLMQLVKVKFGSLGVDELWQCKRRQIAYSDFIGSRVFNDF